MDIYKLIDYYIDKYLEEKAHQTDGYTLAGDVTGIIMDLPLWWHNR